MFNKIPSQKKSFLAFCTWCLLRIEYKSLAALSSKHSKKFVEFLWVGAKIYSLLVFRKITFRIHLNFSPLAGIIFLLTFWWNYISWKRLCLLKSLLTAFCPMLYHLMFYDFLSQKNVFSHPAQLHVHHFLNRLWHSPQFHLQRCFITFWRL